MASPAEFLQAQLAQRIQIVDALASRSTLVGSDMIEKTIDVNASEFQCRVHKIESNFSGNSVMFKTDLKLPINLETMTMEFDVACDFGAANTYEGLNNGLFASLVAPATYSPTNIPQCGTGGAQNNLLLSTTQILEQKPIIAFRPENMIDRIEIRLNQDDTITIPPTSAADLNYTTWMHLVEGLYADPMRARPLSLTTPGYFMSSDEDVFGWLNSKNMMKLTENPMSQASSVGPIYYTCTIDLGKYLRLTKTLSPLKWTTLLSEFSVIVRFKDSDQRINYSLFKNPLAAGKTPVQNETPTMLINPSMRLNYIAINDTNDQLASTLRTLVNNISPVPFHINFHGTDSIAEFPTGGTKTFHPTALSGIPRTVLVFVTQSSPLVATNVGDRWEKPFCDKFRRMTESNWSINIQYNAYTQYIPNIDFSTGGSNVHIMYRNFCKYAEWRGNPIMSFQEWITTYPCFCVRMDDAMLDAIAVNTSDNESNRVTVTVSGNGPQTAISNHYGYATIICDQTMTLNADGQWHKYKVGAVSHFHTRSTVAQDRIQRIATVTDLGGALEDLRGSI